MVSTPRPRRASPLLAKEGSGEVGCSPHGNVEPGSCVPWEVKREELPAITGDPELVERVWRQVDSLGNTLHLANASIVLAEVVLTTH